MSPKPDWAEKEAERFKGHFLATNSETISALIKALRVAYSKGIEEAAKMVEQRKGISEHHSDLAKAIRALVRELEEG